jgi:hypothetical protein
VAVWGRGWGCVVLGFEKMGRWGMMGRRDIGVGFISGFSISSPRAGWQALGEEMSSPSAFPLALGDFFVFFLIF